MKMITNEERKKVATKLREKHCERQWTFEPQDMMMQAYNRLYDLLDCLSCLPKRCDLFLDLADLIEPESERTCELEPPKSGKRRCKRCGAFVSTDAVWDCFGVIPSRFCPNCGAKMVE